MKQVLPGNRLTRILLAASVVLAVILAFEWYLMQRTTTDIWQTPPPGASASNTLATAVYSAPGIEVFDEILDRPMFIEGREPPQETDNAQAPTTAAKPAHFNLLLEGVAITPETRVAVVREISTKKLLRLAEGTEHQGWKLEHVSTAGVTFTQDQEVRELTLEIDTNPGNRRQLFNIPAKRPNIAGEPVTLEQIQLKKNTGTAGATFTQDQQVRELTQEIDSNTGNARQPDNTPAKRPNILEQIQLKKNAPPTTAPANIPAP